MQTSITSKKADFKEAQLSQKLELNNSKIIGADSIPKTTVDFSAAPPTEPTIRAVEEYEVDNLEEVPQDTQDKVSYPWYERTGSTLAIGAISILEGLIDVADELTDGIFHLGADISELTGDKEGAAATREFIAVDWADKLNDYLFNEDTGVAKNLNDASYMKYDGAVAKKLRSTTKSIAEITAATMCPGVGSTMFLGFLAGSGNAAEKKYQKVDENGEYQYNPIDEILINVSGALGSLSWIANRALGKGVKDLAGTIKQNKSVLPTLQEAFHDICNWDFVKTAFKKQLKGITGVTTIANTGFEVAPDIMAILTGEKENNFGNWLKVAGKGAWYFASLALLSELKGYVKNPQAYKTFYDPKSGEKTKALTDQLAKLKAGNTQDLMKFKPDQQKMLIDEILANSDNPETELFRIFKSLNNSDADKLLRNISSDSGRQEQVVKMLAEGIMKYNEDETVLDDIGNMGTNFQKYIINNLPVEQQDKLAEELAKLYQSGKMTAEDIRKIIDPTDSDCATFLEKINGNMDNAGVTKFTAELGRADQFHELSKEVNKVLDDLVKPITKTVAKTATSDSKVKTLREAWKNISDYFTPNGDGNKTVKTMIGASTASLATLIMTAHNKHFNKETKKADKERAKLELAEKLN